MAARRGESQQRAGLEQKTEPRHADLVLTGGGISGELCTAQQAAFQPLCAKTSWQEELQACWGGGRSQGHGAGVGGLPGLAGAGWGRGGGGSSVDPGCTFVVSTGGGHPGGGVGGAVRGSLENPLGHLPHSPHPPAFSSGYFRCLKITRGAHGSFFCDVRTSQPHLLFEAEEHIEKVTSETLWLPQKGVNKEAAASL